MRIVRSSKRWSNKGKGPDNFYGAKNMSVNLGKMSKSHGIGPDLTPEIIAEVQAKLGIKPRKTK